MRRVAVLAYWYPPLNAAGSQRAAALARYLPQYGWEPIVVTVEPECRRYLDPPLIEPLLASGSVFRTRDRSLHTWVSRWVAGGARSERLEALAFDNVRAAGRLGWSALHVLYQQIAAFPDEVWPWVFDYRRIRDHLVRSGASAVLSTSPPVSSHLLAARLARDLSVPWIADLRDPWTGRTSRRRLRPLARLDRWLERRTLRRADALVTVSHPIATGLAEKYGDHVTVVPNGFDPADLPSPRRDGASADRRRFTLLHTGTLTYPTRDPGALFDALGSLVASGELSAAELEIQFLGRHLEVARQALATRPALAPSVHLEKMVPREEALSRQRAASVLVVLGSSDPVHAGDLTTKVFEYLHAGRPVLAFGPPGGALDRLLRETRGGLVVSSVEEARAALLGWIRELRATGRIGWAGDVRAISRYDRRALVGELASTLDAVAAAHPALSAEAHARALRCHES